MRRALLALAVVASLPLGQAFAQTAAPRRHVEQSHAWFQLFGEQRLSKRWALHLEAQSRRADLDLGPPQQFLTREGLIYDVTSGMRVALGHAYAHSSVYGELPAAAPSEEHRIWQQLQLSSRTGAVAWSHRFRTEQRWLEQTSRASNGDVLSNGWRFRQRARAFTRATVDAPSFGVPLKQAYLTAHGELFAQIGATPDGQVFDQSRLAVQGGWRFSPRLRVEAGYLQQLIQRGGSRNTENNHTLLVSLFATGG